MEYPENFQQKPKAENNICSSHFICRTGCPGAGSIKPVILRVGCQVLIHLDFDNFNSAHTSTMPAVSYLGVDSGAKGLAAHLKYIITTVVLVFVTVSWLVSSHLHGLEERYTPNFKSVPNVRFYDLSNYAGSENGWQMEERILFCVPLRDAAAHLPMFFSHMRNLTYPHHLIDLAFLVSDSKDDTMGELLSHLDQVQSDSDPSMPFGEIEIFEKDFGQAIGQGFSDRHGFAAQGPRRKLMARARNWLWSVAIKPYHSYVYWRDADVEIVPATILEDLMHHDKDVIVPNVWRPLPEWLGNQQPYDLNSWQESDGGLELAKTLDEDSCIVEGYPEYSTWRPHLAYLRDPYGDPEVEMELDGIGGVSILTKARVFRTGSHFPAFSFEKHAETEAFGKMSKRMGYLVIGLPHYVIWHIYEPLTDDLKYMEQQAIEETRRQEEAKIKKVYDKVWGAAFEDVQMDWGKERVMFLKNTDMSRHRKIIVDWSENEK